MGTGDGSRGAGNGRRPPGWRCIAYGWSGSATSHFPGARSTGLTTRWRFSANTSAYPIAST